MALGVSLQIFLDDRPVPGTGDYYYEDPRYVGLICIEDLIVMLDEMGIEHGYDVQKVLWLGKMMEKKQLEGGSALRQL